MRNAASAIALFFYFGMASAVMAQTPALPNGPGRAIVEKACAQCHKLTIVSAAEHSAEDWRIVLNAMIHLGARVSPGEFDTVAAYLAKNFPQTLNQGVAPPVISSPPPPRGLPKGY